MKTVTLVLCAAAAVMLSGCCGGSVSIPSCGRPAPICNMSPSRVAGHELKVPGRSWTAADTYTAVDSSTVKVYR